MSEPTKPTPLTRIATRAKVLGIDLDPGEKNTSSAWSIRLFGAKRDARRAAELDPSEANAARLGQVSELESLVSNLVDARRADMKAASDNVRPRERTILVDHAAALRLGVTDRLDALDAEAP